MGLLPSTWLTKNLILTFTAQKSDRKIEWHSSHNDAGATAEAVSYHILNSDFICAVHALRFTIIAMIISNYTDNMRFFVASLLTPESVN
jgi:hypothetical protein